MRAVVAGAGWVTVAGPGRLHAGDGFSFSGGLLPVPSRREVFRDPFTRFGRLDEFSKVGLAAITLALRDAGLEEWRDKRPVGLVAGSRFGCLATDAEFLETVIPEGGALASPNLFAYTLPNAFLGEAAIRHGLMGPTLALLGETGVETLRYGVDCLAAGEAEAVVAGICDVVPPPAVRVPEGFAPGALFVVLLPASAALPKVGLLSRDARGGVARNGAPVTDLPWLVGTLVAERKAP